MPVAEVGGAFFPGFDTQRSSGLFWRRRRDKGTSDETLTEGAGSGGGGRTGIGLLEPGGGGGDEGRGRTGFGDENERRWNLAHRFVNLWGSGIPWEVKLLNRRFVGAASSSIYDRLKSGRAPSWFTDRQRNLSAVLNGVDLSPECSEFFGMVQNLSFANDKPPFSFVDFPILEIDPTEVKRRRDISKAGFFAPGADLLALEQKMLEVNGRWIAVWGAVENRPRAFPLLEASDLQTRWERRRDEKLSSGL